MHMEQPQSTESTSDQDTRHVQMTFPELLKSVKFMILITILFSIISCVLHFTTPILVFWIIESLQSDTAADRDHTSNRAIWLLCSLLAVGIVKAVVDSHLYYTGTKIGLKVRTCVMHAIYRKSMTAATLPGMAIMYASRSNSILLSIDAERIYQFASQYQQPFLQIPLSIFIAVACLYYIIGWACLVGISLIIVLMGLTSLLSKGIVKYQEQVLFWTDKRVGLVNEVVAGIRSIKYQAQAPHFYKKISHARQNELLATLKLWLGNFVLFTIGASTSILVALLTFYVYVGTGNTLTASTAFTAVNLLATVGGLLQYLPQQVMLVFKARVSWRRIREFLDLQDIASAQNQVLVQEEVDECTPLLVASSTDTIINDTGDKVKMSGCDVEYYGCENGFKLHNINLTIPSGKLTLITGPIGSGKSTLLKSLLGLLKTTGSITVPSSISYAPQQPWLLNASIKENIIFGSPFNQNRYRQTLKLTQLLPDLALFPHKDLTMVGESGVTLSGGQKARVSVARALYASTSLVLLDDPLSALDAPTAHKLVDGLRSGMQGRTLVVVSHHLFGSDYRVEMRDGRVVAQGVGLDVTLEKSRQVSGVRVEKIESGDEDVLYQPEFMATGSVSIGVYKQYFQSAGGFPFLFFLFLFMAGTNIAELVNSWWLKEWVDNVSGADPSQVSGYLLVYAYFGMIIIGTQELRLACVLIGSYKASVNLHNSLLKSILNAPMRFFETTPVGRIVNRFTKDIEHVDTTVMTLCQHALSHVTKLSTILTVIASTSPYFVIAIPPLIALYTWLASFYLSTSRQLKRIDSVTRSPIYSQFSETLTGLPVIHALKSTHRFTLLFHSKLSLNNTVSLHLSALNQWFAQRTKMGSAGVVFLAGLVCVCGDFGDGWSAL